MQKQTLFPRTLITILLLCIGSVAIAQTTEFRARLSEVPTTPQDYLDIRGVGEVFVRLEGNTLTVTGTFRGLSSVATGVHVHNAPKAMNGPPIHTLQATNATEGEITGVLELTAEQVEALRNEELYIMLHSENHPSGLIRGWLLPRNS